MEKLQEEKYARAHGFSSTSEDLWGDRVREGDTDNKGGNSCPIVTDLGFFSPYPLHGVRLHGGPYN